MATQRMAAGSRAGWMGGLKHGGRRKATGNRAFGGYVGRRPRAGQMTVKMIAIDRGFWREFPRVCD
jgi:hypothetical protein